MKSTKLILLFAILIVLTHCTKVYMVQNEKPMPLEISESKTVSISWIDMNPANYKGMKYDTEKEWTEVIYNGQINMFQYYLLQEVDKKNQTISFRKPNEGPSNNVDLNIDLKMVHYDFGYVMLFGGKDVMDVEVKFTNKEGKELYSTIVSVEHKTSGFNMNEGSLYGRIEGCLYNLVFFVADSLQKKKK